MPGEIMMNDLQLDQYLRRYSAKERWHLCNSHAAQEERVTNSAAQEAKLLESSHFMKPEQKIVISRQDRFEPIHVHKHDFIELCYVWSGECHQTVEGEYIRIRQGDICILDTRAEHSFAPGREEDILINILIRREFFDSAFLSRMSRHGILSEFLVNAVLENRSRKHYLYFSAHRNQRIHEIVRRILTEYFTGDIGVETMLESYLTILFTELFRMFRTESQDQENPRESLRLLQFLEYMDKNYEWCTLSRMSQEFGLSENYLTTLLKEKTGHSFLEYIQEKKLQKARLLLENTDFSIAEIIEQCGYHNMNHFYRLFKASENCTLAQYRQRHRTS